MASNITLSVNSCTQACTRLRNVLLGSDTPFDEHWQTLISGIGKTQNITKHHIFQSSTWCPPFSSGWLILSQLQSYKHVGILVIFFFLLGHSDSTVCVLTPWKSMNGVLTEQWEDKKQLKA